MENQTSFMSEESLLEKLNSCTFGLSLAGVISERSIEGFRRGALNALQNLEALYPHNKLLSQYKQNLQGAY